jgi:hypothetical protein
VLDLVRRMVLRRAHLGKLNEPSVSFCRLIDRLDDGASKIRAPLTCMAARSIDIAVAVGHILDQCTAEVGGVGWRAAGVEQANGNPDIYVHALLS